jgi:hypothetical protein
MWPGNFNFDSSRSGITLTSKEAKIQLVFITIMANIQINIVKTHQI